MLIVDLRRIKESLRKRFAELANDFERQLSAISSELAAIEGPLEVSPHSWEISMSLCVSLTTAAAYNRTNNMRWHNYKHGYQLCQKFCQLSLASNKNAKLPTSKRTITRFSHSRIFSSNTNLSYRAYRRMPLSSTIRSVLSSLPLSYKL